MRSHRGLQYCRLHMIFRSAHLIFRSAQLSFRGVHMIFRDALRAQWRENLVF